MSFPNFTDIATTTIEKRSRKVADNVVKSNALLTKLNERGNIRTFSGGTQIMEEIAFAENGNFAWYSGPDLLSVAAQDVISSAAYSIKQCATAVVLTGLEKLQNNGREKQIDLLEARIAVAESTMANNQAQGLYSDGTGFGGKQVGGLQAAVPVSPTTGTYGGIDRSAWPFWRSVLYSMGTGPTAANVQAAMNALYVQLVRGSEHPDLIPMDNNFYGAYLGSLQAIQRFTNPKLAELGFENVRFMLADCVLDGGIGGFAPANVAWMLNTKYLFWRPHADRNNVPIAPDKRAAINQDIEAQIIGWAGNLTLSGSMFHGYLKGS